MLDWLSLDWYNYSDKGPTPFGCLVCKLEEKFLSANSLSSAIVCDLKGLPKSTFFYCVRKENRTSKPYQMNTISLLERRIILFMRNQQQFPYKSEVTYGRASEPDSLNNTFLYIKDRCSGRSFLLATLAL